MQITIVYNNITKKGFKKGWGFSCVIKHPEGLMLFDTGCDGPGLIYNLKKLDVPINKIKTIFLTHDHWDHTGGLFNVLEKNSNLKVILPYSFSEKFKQEIESRVEIIEVKKKKKLFDNIYSTGEFKKNHCEQALILNTQQGYVLVTGCSHPGLESFLKILPSFKGCKRCRKSQLLNSFFKRWVMERVSQFDIDGAHPRLEPISIWERGAKFVSRNFTPS